MPASRLHGQQTRPIAYVENADPFGRVELVSRQREQIHVQIIYLQIELSPGLNGIGVEGNPAGSGNPADFSDRLYGAYLVVRIHHRDQHRLSGDGPTYVIRVYHSPAIDGHIGHAETEHARQLLAGVAYGVVFDGRSDDVPTSLATGKGHTPQGEIVALGATTGKDDLRGSGAEDVGHRLARRIDPRARQVCGPVDTRGIAVYLLPIGQHGLHDPRVNRRCRSVIHVDRRGCDHTPTPSTASPNSDWQRLPWLACQTARRQSADVELLTYRNRAGELCLGDSPL